MSLSKHTSPYQKVELSENKKRPTSSRLTPIACRVCDKVFFDNVSLVLHFECHLEDEISLARLHGRHLSLNLSPFSSSVVKMNEACHPVLPKKKKCFTPNDIPTDVSLVDIPVLNSMPPIINSFFDAQRNVRNLSKDSKLFRHSTMSHHRYRHLTPVPTLKLRLQNGEQKQPSDNKNPHMKQLEKPNREIIVISDDEEDKNRNADEIDLTLRL